MLATSWALLHMLKRIRTLRLPNPAFHDLFPADTKSSSLFRKTRSRAPTRAMSTQQANNESLRHQRILANCKKIWAHVEEFEFDIDYHEGPWGGDCQAMVREDRGLTFGPILTMTNVCDGSERAWNELDRMLRLWAAQVDSGEPMDRQEALNIFSKPPGPFDRDNRPALEQFIDEAAKRGEDTSRADPMDLEAIAAGETIIEVQEWMRDFIRPRGNAKPDNTKSVQDRPMLRQQE